MKKTISVILPMALLASCTSELADTENNDVARDGNVDKVTLRIRPYEYADGTRTSLTATDNGLTFAWADGDAIGVFPVKEPNSQARQVLNVPAGCGEDAHYASFDGAGWGLKKDNDYAAYSPYNGSLPSDTRYDEVPVDMTGQDGTLETIGRKYDYMYAPSSFVDEVCINGKTHELVFDFNHIAAMIQLRLTVPVAATWSSITLRNTSDDAVWRTTATMDVSSGKVTPENTASSISLALSNVTTTQPDQQLVLYVAALPTTTGALSLTAVTSDRKKYTVSLASKNLQAGKAYRYTATLTEVPVTGTANGYDWVDLGLPSGTKWATRNVGASAITEKGNYYAWGEIETQSSEHYNWNYYKWCDNFNLEPWFKKYLSNSTYAYYSDFTVLEELEPADDVAYQVMGSSWRMPNREQMQELFEYTYWLAVTKYNGIEAPGICFFAPKAESDMRKYLPRTQLSPNSYTRDDPHIFLPYAGIWQTGGGTMGSSACCYWSRTLDTSDNRKAYYLRLGSSYYGVSSYSRYAGMTVRGVLR